MPRVLEGSEEATGLLEALVTSALAEYGAVGIYDPSELAEIDFLNHPELLVNMVSDCTKRASRLAKPGMLLMTEVTSQWMQMMVERQYAHTEAYLPEPYGSPSRVKLFHPDPLLCTPTLLSSVA
jgi:hypothetical protein